MSDYTEEELDAIWQKGRVIEGMDPSVYRLDAADALMKKGLYGNEGNLGWEVDHIYPKEKLKAKHVPEDRWNDMINLRPMNAKNNVAKGEDYPKYSVAVQYDAKSKTNKEVNGKVRIVESGVQAKIASAYGEWL